MKKNNKKGSVEMSLNLIIMLIIGMVVLGLVIGFVNKLVHKGTANFDKQLGANEKLKLDKVKSCSEIFCINPNPSFTIKKGTKTNIFVKIRNVGNSKFTIDPGPLDNTQDFKLVGVIPTPTTTEGFDLSGPGFDIAPASEDAEMYTIKVKTDTSVGTYYLPFIAKIDGTDYKKVITVNVE